MSWRAATLTGAPIQGAQDVVAVHETEGAIQRIYLRTLQHGINHFIRRRFPHPDFECAHRLGNVLDLLLAEICKRNWMLPQVIAYASRQADSARLRESFQSSRDIDAIHNPSS